ncbi:MAG: MFS transporter [Zestosphaera sp.]
MLKTKSNLDGSGRAEDVRILLITLLIFYVITYFHRVMTGVMKSEIDQIALESSIDPDLLLAILSSVYFYAYTLAQLFVGVLIDSFGIKRIGSLFAILMFVGTFMMYFMSPQFLIFGRAVVGFSCATAFLAYQRATSLSYSSKMQGKLTSYALLVGNLSAMIATYPLRLALNSIGLKTFLEVMMITTLVIATLLYSVTKDTGLNARDGKLIETLSHFRHLIRDPHMWGTQRSIYSNLWSYASLSICLGSEATDRVVWVEFRGK